MHGHVVGVVVLVVVREDQFGAGAADGLDEGVAHRRGVVEILVRLPKADTLCPDRIGQAGHLPPADVRGLAAIEAGAVHQPLRAVGEADEEQLVSALVALEHRAQASHLVILMGHDRNDVHLNCSLDESSARRIAALSLRVRSHWAIVLAQPATTAILTWPRPSGNRQSARLRIIA